MTVLTLAVPTLPFFAALLLALPGAPRRAGLALFPWAALPAVALGILAPEGLTFLLQEVLLGTRLTIDVTGKVFLLFTGILWTATGTYARVYTRGDPRRVRFAMFHLLTLAGNLTLIVAGDAVTFYLGFALMTFAAYGLVVHTQSAEARRAGRVYLVMAVLGEAMLLAGLLLTASESVSLELPAMAAAVGASSRSGVIIALMIGGFAIKAGAIPLHVWLPLAHPVAPTPASAVLSGAMIKAGLLGWLRFLPLGITVQPTAGATLVALGLAAAFFGVIVGVTQRDPKTTLAYSSISQMGFLNVGIGIALGGEGAWPVALGATLAYVVHHGLAKGALFLGVGVAAEAHTRRTRMAAMIALTFAAVSVAGAPLTSGSVAKSYLKATAPLAPLLWPAALDVMLPLAAVGSTLLMARFLVLVARAPAHAPSPGRGGSLWPPWLGLLIPLAVLMWILPARFELGVPGPGVPTPAAAWLMIWPVLLGALIAWLALYASRRHTEMLRRLYIQPGDLLVLVERPLAAAKRRLTRTPIEGGETPVVSLGSRWYGLYALGEGDQLARLEARLTTRMGAGLAVLALLLALGGALWRR